jgi:hypothetical protein
MTPEKLKLVEHVWMWLTLVRSGTIQPNSAPPDPAAVDALREVLDELKSPKGPVILGWDIATTEPVDPRAWPATNTAIKALADIWIARWGAGSAPGDVIRNAVLTLKKDGAPWEAVRRSFQRYVDIVDNQFASPYAWRKKWQSFDPETPEHDAEGARIADSMDRQLRQRRRSGGGMERVGVTLKRLPEKR